MEQKQNKVFFYIILGISAVLMTLLIIVSIKLNNNENDSKIGLKNYEYNSCKVNYYPEKNELNTEGNTYSYTIGYGISEENEDVAKCAFIKSSEELEEYLKMYKSNFVYLSPNEKTWDLTTQYDTSYFKDNDIVIIADNDTGTFCNTYIKKVYSNENTLNIIIEMINTPEKKEKTNLLILEINKGMENAEINYILKE